MVDGKSGSALPLAWEMGHTDGPCELQGLAQCGSPRALGLQVVGGYSSCDSMGPYGPLGHPIHWQICQQCSTGLWPVRVVTLR